MQLEYKEIEWQAVHRVYVFDHEQYAPKLKLKYKELRSSSSKWKKIGALSLPDGVPNEDGQTRYDYATQSLVTHGVKSWGKALSALSKGSLDGIGEFSARCEGVLDVDEGMAKSADYFDHTYRDLSSYLFAGIRLYDIWAAETLVDILDEVATAFMIEVKGKETVRTRIGPQIYDQIKQNFFAYRRYRIVRHALGRLHLNPKAKVDPEFESLRSNLNHALMLAKHDPAIMSQRLQEAGNRDVFFAELATELKAIYQPQLGLPVPEHFSENRDNRAAASQLLQSISEKVLKSHELLGF